jgi:23S rRNA (cytidine1920-2'-O)/16S rRNA (cytidine1409-2'-O)-methyltransferase
MAKIRLDQLLFDRILVESRTKAQALIMAGQVFVDGHKSDKVGTRYEENAQICVKELFPYVSRGALKLEKAFTEFNLSFKGKIVCDIGSSTGGFTDFTLKNGAKKVFAVDVGTGQLAQKIRVDERVKVMERTDFRSVDTFDEDIDIFVCDVSFISLKKIIPKIKDLSQKQTSFLRMQESMDPRDRHEDDKRGIEAVLLIKPQFEAGTKEVSRGKGVIKDEALRQEIVEDIKSFAISNGFNVMGIVESPITGAKGNVEYLIYLKL